MPYFRILVTYDDGSSLKCIRQHSSYDIEFVNRFFTEQLKRKPGKKRVEQLEVVMVSKQIGEVKAYISSQERKGYHR